MYFLIELGILITVILIVVGFIYYPSKNNSEKKTNNTTNHIVAIFSILFIVSLTYFIYQNVKYEEVISFDFNNIEKIENHIKDNPEDFKAYQMLGLAYTIDNKLDLAINSYEKSYNLGNRDIDLLTEYASSLAAKNNGSFVGLPAKLISEAINTNPESVKALYLAGIIAANNNDFALAKNIWQKALSLSEEGSTDANLLINVLGQLDEFLNQNNDINIEVVVDIDEDLYKQFFDGFIMVYAVGEKRPMPIAIEKIALRDFSGIVILNNSKSIMPTNKLSEMDKVIIKARLSKTGNAIKQAGDIEVKSSLLDVKNQTLELKIVK